MKILWVEDDENALQEGLLANFGRFLYQYEQQEIQSLLDERNFDQLKRYLSEKTHTTIRIESCLSIAYQRITAELDFDLFVLDVKFNNYSSEDPSDVEWQIGEQLKSDIIRDMLDDSQEAQTRFEEEIWNAQVYTGILLFSLICKQYKSQRKWTRDDIEKKVCFFTANNKDCQNFTEQLKKIRSQYHLDSEAFAFGQKNLFKKDHNEEFQKWLQLNPYLEILKILGAVETETAVKTYEQIQENRSKKQQIPATLTAIRNLEASIIDHLCHQYRIDARDKNGTWKSFETILNELVHKSIMTKIEQELALTIHKMCSEKGAHLKFRSDIQSFSECDREYQKYLDFVDGMVGMLNYLLLWYGETLDSGKRKEPGR